MSVKRCSAAAARRCVRVRRDEKHATRRRRRRAAARRFAGVKTRVHTHVHSVRDYPRDSSRSYQVSADTPFDVLPLSADRIGCYQRHVVMSPSVLITTCRFHSLIPRRLYRDHFLPRLLFCHGYYCHRDGAGRKDADGAMRDERAATTRGRMRAASRSAARDA